MLLDKTLELGLAQAVTVTALATNVIDLGGVRNIGAGEDLFLCVKVGAAALAAGAATVNFQLQTSASSDLSGATTILDSGAIPKANLTANTILKFKLPTADYKRYLGLNYSVGTGPLTAGDFSAWIATDVQDQPATGYAAGFSIQ